MSHIVLMTAIWAAGRVLQHDEGMDSKLQMKQ